MKRIREICGCLPRVKVYADVGCDHGYCARYMLEDLKGERVYVTDVSAESLKKAERLLAAHVAEGRCVPVCCDGLSGVPEPCGCVLIAGLGGEEIVHILKQSGLPEKFVLQPMKNAEKVREYLVSQRAKILKDYTFRDGKFYDLIAGEREGGSEYTDYELRFGRDNLTDPKPDFYDKIKEEQGKLRAIAGTRMSAENREKVREKLLMLGEVIDAIENDL
ncbi:MAG: class I SAM-dependent methyltransferase [Clostridia bacterium]|nr:class I SAM-dependent methyltransferase [Clostridia bacterium]